MKEFVIFDDKYENCHQLKPRLAGLEGPYTPKKHHAGLMPTTWSIKITVDNAGGRDRTLDFIL